MVQEIILEQTQNTWEAKAVRFSYAGEDHIVRTKGEIILCGGSVSSPQLLELSGIGDPVRLGSAGISCKVTSPHVGENLQDHLMTAMIFEISSSITTPEDLRADPLLAAAADKEYAMQATGPRTAIPSSVSYLPFTHFMQADELSKMASPLLLSQKKNGSPYVQHDHVILSRLTSPQNLGQIEYNFDVSNYNPHFQSEPGKKYATMLMMLQYPFSRGSVHLQATMDQNKRKATAEDKPLIDPRYFAGQGGEVDLALMVESQKFADQICKTAPLSDIIVKRVFPPEDHQPGTVNGHSANGVNGHSGNGVNGHSANEVNGHSSKPKVDEDIFGPWIRNTMMTDWHPVGTCSMGRSIAEGAVVDHRLRVHGVKGLRVCDASIMPLQISAHLQATVYAIGEKGADLIKEDWK